MIETLARHWWVVALRGAAALIFGVLALVWPSITVLVLVALFGAYALVDGAFALGTAIVGRGRSGGSRGWLAVEGLAGIIISGAISVLFGILLMVWPAAGALAVIVLIGLYAIVFGVVLLALSFRLRRLDPAGRPA